jgi:hypothetical protein
VEEQLSGRYKPEFMIPSKDAWPVAVKPVKPCSLKVIATYGTEAERRRLQYVLDFVTSPTRFIGIPDDDREWFSDVNVADLAVLTDADIIEGTDSDGALHVGRLFFVAEDHKERRRPIFWPRTLNAQVTEVPTPPLEDVVAAARDLTPGGWARCFDLSASFFQVELPAAVRRHFTFRTADAWWRFKRLVMGARWSPEVLQAIVECIASEAAQRVGLTAVVRIVVHIDNVRFWSQRRQDCDKVADEFVKLCLAAGITLNKEITNAPHQHGDFLGVEYDYRRAVVCLTGAKRTALEGKRKILASAAATYGDILSLFGMCAFASRVLRIPLARYWPVVKFVRRRAAAFATGVIALTSRANLWPSAAACWQDWIDSLLSNTPVSHGSRSLPTEHHVVFTDASLSGFGAVLCTAAGDIAHYAGKWTHIPGLEHELASSDINALEMKAVDLAVGRFRAQLRNAPVLILVDNTSTMHVLRKGHAREHRFNKYAADALTNLSGLGEVFVGYIATDENPADPLSRGIQPPTEMVSLIAGLRSRLTSGVPACVRPATAARGRVPRVACGVEGRP